MSTIPVGLLDSLIALVAGALFTLVGIMCHRLRKRIAELEETLEQVESQLIDVKGEINTTFTWKFGQEADPTNSGIAQEIETRSEEAERCRQVIEHRVDRIMDIERDDVEE